MGIDGRIVIYAKDAAHADRACTAAFKRISDLDWIMSDYRKDSELMKLCAKAGKGPRPISRDLYNVFERGLAVSSLTDGDFDMTAGPLVALWRKARKTGKLPAEWEIERAKKFVGFKHIQLSKKERTADLKVPGLMIDLGGIAKGYAADEAQKVLKKHGVTIALVELGGDIVVSNPPPGKKGWTIRVPNASETQGPKDIEFANCAISSSGDTEQFTVINGIRYSHVVDPTSGYALTSRIQATVVGKDGFTTDPVSTALTVTSEARRNKLLRAFKIREHYIKVISSP